MMELPDSAIPLEDAKDISRRHHELLTQVSEWLQAEKQKKASKKAQSHQVSTATLPESSTDNLTLRPRTDSQSSDSVSLEKLQKILDDSKVYSESTSAISTRPSSARPGASPLMSGRVGSSISRPRRRSSTRQLIRTASSDTEYQEGDVIVPTCDVVLDNSKTMSYSGGANSSEIEIPLTGRKAEKARQAWAIFKTEILKLAHT
jgi:choline kinase